MPVKMFFADLGQKLSWSLFAVYLAAGLTFGSSIVRDTALFTADVDTVLFFLWFTSFRFLHL